MKRLLFVALVAAVARLCTAQKPCLSPLSPTYPALTVAEGYTAQLVKMGLSRPRSIVVDDRGQLLIAGSRDGIIALVLDEEGCEIVQQKTIIPGDLMHYFNHGLALSPDGKTLYASTTESAFSWSYNSAQLTATDQRQVVSGMTSNGQLTRTLLVPPLHPELLLISRGANENLDMATSSPGTGRSMIKVFNLTNSGSYTTDYTNGGVILGWGLRDAVGVAAHPVSGGIWSVENSVDNVQRYGKDFHLNNPGDELNYHGDLSSSLPPVGPNFGYPWCLAVYDSATIPGTAGDLRRGQQFALAPNSTFSDYNCSEFTPPRLTFAAHSTPLGLVFNGSGEAWVTFHGSWGQQDPVGYLLSMISFGVDGQPVEEMDVKDPGKKVLWSENLEGCPDHCFRPSGVAVGKRGEVYVSGDSTGDLWIVRRNESGAVAGGGGGGASGVKKAAGERSMRVWDGTLVAAVAAAMVWNV